MSLSRVRLLLMAAAMLIAPLGLCAQSPSTVTPQEPSPSPAPGLLPPPATAPAPTTQAAPTAAGDIAEIRVLSDDPTARRTVLARIRIRQGQPYDAQALTDDVQRLRESRRFETIATSTDFTPAGVVVTFVAKTRPVIKKITVTGNRQIKTIDLIKALPFNIGDGMDSVLVEQGRQAILAKYRESGRLDATVAAQQSPDKGLVDYTVAEGPRVVISHVTFAGDTHFGGFKLWTTVSSKARWWPFIKGYLDLDQLQRDVQALRDLYIADGYLDAEVGRELVFTPDKTKVHIYFHINEGPRYRVNEIKFSGNSVYNDRELLARLGTKQGDVQSEPALERAIKGVTDAYGEVGYIYAQVNVDKVFPSPQAPVPAWVARVKGKDKIALVNLAFTIKEQDQYKVGQVIIRGNTVTEDRVIRREMRVYPYQIYNSVAVAESKRHLEESGYFEATSVTITPSGKGEKERDVLVEVKEAHTGQFMIGAGVNTNSGVVGNISFVQRNFNISKPGGWDAIKNGTAFKGAGEVFRISVEPGTEQQRATIEWFTPYIHDKPYSFGSKLFLFERPRESYDETRAGWVGSVGHRFGDDWYGELAARIEGVDVSNVDDDAPEDVREDEGTSLLVGLKGTLTRDRTDSRFLPTKGDRLQVSYEQVTGSFNFGVLEGDYRRYFTVHRDALDRPHIIAARIAAGQIFGDAPVFERFYAGGLGSIRGFAYRGISPRQGRHDDPVGGDFNFFLGAEYTFPLIGQQIRGVLFLDTGTVEQNTGFGNYRAAVGPGIRWVVPFLNGVPFTLDLGFPLLKSDQDDTQLISFSMGVTF